MTTELNPIAALSHNLAEPLTVTQQEALQHALTKIVALGAHVGVNRDQMILLLGVGSRRRRAAGVPGGSIGRSCLKRSNLVLKFQAFAAGLAIE
jgi:hypothetical protein